MDYIQYYIFVKCLFLACFTSILPVHLFLSENHIKSNLHFILKSLVQGNSYKLPPRTQPTFYLHNYSQKLHFKFICFNTYPGKNLYCVG